MAEQQRVVALDRLGMSDLAQGGGKNASLGEMMRHLASEGVRVPGGFATTAFAFHEFIDASQLRPRIDAALAKLDVDDVKALSSAGAEIRAWIVEAPLPPPLEREIADAYGRLLAHSSNAPVAVRSSATAEDLPDASFAGQQETFLNVNALENVLKAVKEVFASLYNDRAIAYRVHKGFAHADVALSVGIQRMVRSDLGAAGVMFTIDTESGFDQVVFITSAYGLGETVVQGAVNPDEFYVYKPALRAGRRAVLRKNLGGKAVKMICGDPGPKARVPTVDVAPADRNRFSIDEADIASLAKQALTVEKHYG